MPRSVIDELQAVCQAVSQPQESLRILPAVDYLKGEGYPQDRIRNCHTPKDFTHLAQLSVCRKAGGEVQFSFISPLFSPPTFIQSLDRGSDPPYQPQYRLTLRDVVLARFGAVRNETNRKQSGRDK